MMFAVVALLSSCDKDEPTLSDRQSSLSEKTQDRQVAALRSSGNDRFTVSYLQGRFSIDVSKYVYINFVNVGSNDITLVIANDFPSTDNFREVLLRPRDEYRYSEYDVSGRLDISYRTQSLFAVSELAVGWTSK